jgi:hypothetical protein
VDWVDEFKKRFGGFWNTIFLILVLIVCLRFSGAEWKDKELQERLLYALYLVLGVISTGIFFGIGTAVLKRFKRSGYATPNTPVDFVSGLKYGTVLGTVVVFTIGLLMVDDYLGPIKELVDVVIKKIGDKIP